LQKLFVALLATFTAHASAAVATLTVPILAPYLHEIYGIEGRYVGLYSSIVYFGSLLAAILSAWLIKAIGAINALKVALLLSAFGMTVLLVRDRTTFFASAIIIGFAFGPMNPVSSVVLADVCPPRLRASVFSVKQGAVPFGVGIAALLTPFVYTRFGASMAILTVFALCMAGLAMVMLTGAFVGADIGKSEQKQSLMSLWRGFHRAFSHRELRRLALVATSLASVQFTFAPTLIYVLVSHGRFQSAFASGILSAVMLSSFFLRPLFGAFADRFGARIVVICIAATVTAFSVVFPFVVTGASRYVAAAAAVVYGVSCFSWNGIVLSMAASRAPRELVGEATAGIMALSLVGASIAPVIFTTLLSAGHGLVLAYLSLAVFAAMALVFVRSIERS